jgi:hypothetical protein
MMERKKIRGRYKVGSSRTGEEGMEVWNLPKLKEESERTWVRALEVGKESYQERCYHVWF